MGHYSAVVAGGLDGNWGDIVHGHFYSSVVLADGLISAGITSRPAGLGATPLVSTLPFFDAVVMHPVVTNGTFVLIVFRVSEVEVIDI